MYITCKTTAVVLGMRPEQARVAMRVASDFTIANADGPISDCVPIPYACPYVGLLSIYHAGRLILHFLGYRRSGKRRHRRVRRDQARRLH